MTSLIEKEYFTVDEVVAELTMPWADIAYLAENGHLRLSVLVFHLAVRPMQDGGPSSALHDGEACTLTGLADLSDRDAHYVLKGAGADVRHFQVSPKECFQLADDAPSVFVARSDLLLRRAERDRLADMVVLKAPGARRGGFRHSPDYRHLQFEGETFSPGPLQAAVIRQLHLAVLAGSPWQNGKAVLARAQSASTRMNDLFKSRKAHWRKLIVSDGNGLYRLAVPGPADAPQQRAGKRR